MSTTTDYDAAELGAIALIRAIHEGDQAADRGEDRDPHDRQMGLIMDQAAETGVDGLIALTAALARIGMAALTVIAEQGGRTLADQIDAYEMHLLISRAGEDA